jgi:hypothetical protein
MTVFGELKEIPHRIRKNLKLTVNPKQKRDVNQIVQIGTIGFRVLKTFPSG